MTTACATRGAPGGYTDGFTAEIYGSTNEVEITCTSQEYYIWLYWINNQSLIKDPPSDATEIEGGTLDRAGFSFLSAVQIGGWSTTCSTNSDCGAVLLHGKPANSCALFIIGEVAQANVGVCIYESLCNTSGYEF
jgi:hypothetical protein